MQPIEETGRGIPSLGVSPGTARLAQLAALAAAFAFVYADTAALVAREWLGPTVSYGFIILLISAFMAWKRREAARDAAGQPAVLRGTLLTAAGCLLLLAGKAGGSRLLQEVSIVVTLMGLILAVYGPGTLKVFVLPVAYLVFMFPFIPELLTDYSIYFQLSSASVASGALGLTGMQVAREGQMLYLPHIALNVVKDCSGVHSIVTLVALSVPMVYFSRKPGLAKAALVVSAFFIGIIANGLRIALIGIWTKYAPDADIHGPMNLLLVSIFIVGFGIAALMLLSRLLPDTKDVTEGELRTDTGRERGVRSALYPAVAVCAVLVLAGTYARAFEVEPFYPQKDVRDLPLAIGDWKGEDAAGLRGPFGGASPDRSVNRIYRDGHGNAAGLYVAYFAAQDEGSKVFGYRYGLTNESSGEGSVRLPGPGGLTVNKTSLASPGGAAGAYYWYVVDGRAESGRYMAELKLIANALMHRRNNAAIVIVTEEGGDAAGFIRSIDPVLKAYLT